MTAVRRLADAAEQRVDDIRDQYAGDGEHPVGSYAVLLGTYGGMVATLGACVARRQHLPDRFDGRDFVLLGIATQKLSRLVAKDAVGAAVRAPFTRFEESTGEGEVHEEVRGSG